MSVSDKRRNEYSKQYHCRLLNEEAAELEEILKKEKITFVDFLRKSIKAAKKDSLKDIMAYKNGQDGHKIKNF